MVVRLTPDFSAISYDVMDIQESGGETTLYAWIYYVEYHQQNGQLEKVSASSAHCCAWT